MKPTFTLTIADEGKGEADTTVEQRLRAVLKRLLRSHSFRVIRIQEDKKTQEGENQR